MLGLSWGQASKSSTLAPAFWEARYPLLGLNHQGKTKATPVREKPAGFGQKPFGCGSWGLAREFRVQSSASMRDSFCVCVCARLNMGVFYECTPSGVLLKANQQENPSRYWGPRKEK